MPLTTSFAMPGGGPRIIRRIRRCEWQIAIFEKIYSLDAMPESKPFAFENPDFPYEIREALFGLGSRPVYRILFTIIDDTVNVLTVKAAEEDWISPDGLR